MLHQQTGSSPVHQNETPFWKRGLVLFVVILLAIVGIAAYLSFTSPFSPLKTAAVKGYVIPNVPPLSAYNEEMFAWRIFDARKAYTVAMLRYWGEDMKFNGALYEELFSVFPAAVSFPRIENFLDTYGYRIEVRQLDTPDKLRAYLNEETRAPLLFNQLADADMPTSDTYKILIGLKNNGKTVVMHDYFNGPAFEMPWEDFEELWQKTSEVGWGYHRYMVIQPIDETKGEAVRQRPVVPYPTIPDTLLQFQPLLVRIMAFSKEPSEERAERLIAETLENQLFADLHPFLKILAYDEIGVRKWRFGKRDEALVYLTKAEDINHDLDKRYGGWPLYYAEKDYFSKILLGRYYNAVGDTEKGMAAFREGLALREEWPRILDSVTF